LKRKKGRAWFADVTTQIGKKSMASTSCPHHALHEYLSQYHILVMSDTSRPCAG